MLYSITFLLRLQQLVTPLANWQHAFFAACHSPARRFHKQQSLCFHVNSKVLVDDQNLWTSRRRRTLKRSKLQDREKWKILRPSKRCYPLHGEMQKNNLWTPVLAQWYTLMAVRADNKPSIISLLCALSEKRLRYCNSFSHSVQSNKRL